MDIVTNRRNDIDIYYRETPDYSVVNTHFHNVYQIIYVVSGTVGICIDNKDYSVSENSMVFISNFEKHSVHISQSPYKRFVISLARDFNPLMLQDSLLLSILMQRPPDFSHVVVLNEETAQSVLEILHAMLTEYEQKQDYWSIRLPSLVIELLIKLYRFSSACFPVREVSNAAKIVTGIQQYIMKNDSGEITLEDMAARHFISVFYLARIFKKITGYTFKEYLILHKLSIAKDLLIHTNKPGTEVCDESGYSNINHFIRIFKSYEGITPYQYRKRHL